MNPELWNNIADIASTLVQFGVFATGIWMLLKAFKTFPNEKKKSDLEIKREEASVAEQMENLAEKSIGKALKFQEQIDQLIGDIRIIKEENIHLKNEISDVRDENISLKAEIQEVREENTDLKIQLGVVKCELQNYQEENSALKEWAETLVKQIYEKAPDIIPAKMRSVKKLDCSKGE